ncbi:hypothetical protein DFP72DRAFT_459391 [Ephemerocybe angulata]|uniref:DUF6697 domain-containing protein n=1 Tax=Ephemerocybe angulata TaxID=980116 RepID=A0A8H6M5M5_9AGAR|nr:hypothetical protein DFP72DRAFT_459391 [Tulosesus angulatus]
MAQKADLDALRKAKRENSILSGQVLKLSEDVDGLRQDIKGLREDNRYLRDDLKSSRDEAEVWRKRVAELEAKARRAGLARGASQTTIDSIPVDLVPNVPRGANTGRAVVPRRQEHSKDENRIAAVEVRSGTSQGAGLHDEVDEDGDPPTSSSTLSSGGVEPESHLTPKAEEPQPEVELRLRSPSLEIIEESAYRERRNARVVQQTNASGSNVPGISQKALGKRKAVIVPTASPKKKLKRPAATPLTHPIKPESSPPKPPPRPPHKFKEEDVFVLPAADVETYLADAPPLPIDPGPSALHVPRNFIYLAYGGSPYQFLQYIPAERNPSQTGSGRRRLVFPMPEMNPAMPLHPGESGLLFASRHEVLSDPPWGVFRKNLDGGEARWLYLGEYESVLVGRMTKAQFRMQRAMVKARWAKLIIEQKVLFHTAPFMVAPASRGTP